MRSGLVALVIAAPFVVGVAVADPGPEGESVFTFQDREINESSGLVVLDDVAVTVNDSGDSSRIFVVSPDEGSSEALSYSGSAVDVEALAPAAKGERAVWVGDIGDNLAKRSDLSVVHVPLDGSAASRHPVSWKGGPADAETLMVHPVTGQMYVVTKDVVDGEVLRGPATLSSSGNVFAPVAKAPALITDGAFFGDGKHFILRNYGAAYVFETSSMRQIGVIDLPVQAQGEGIAVTPSGEVWLSSEGVGSEVLRIELPAEIASAVGADRETPSASPSLSSSPTDSESPTPGPSSEEGNPAGNEDLDGPAVLPWLLGGLAAAVAFGVLIRSLRPR
ncbi:MAG TPA: hypothetical protein VIR30_15260 [Nocardioides sp.]